MTETKLRQNEQGFASIVIALILIIVLALLTVGFAQLARREQQDALDKQLATQANYAAESGVNDVYHAIASGALSSTNTQWNSISGLITGGSAGTTCLNTLDTSSNPDFLNNFDINPLVNSTDGVEYTCALVNLTPPTLSDDLPASGSNPTPWTTVFSTTNADGTPGTLSNLDITWGSADGHTAAPPSTPTDALPPDTPGGWNGALPVLEVSITPLSDGTAVTSQTLIQDTFTIYLYPSSGSGNTVAYPSGYDSTDDSGNADGQIIPGNCQNLATAGKTPTCNVTITGLPGSAGDYYLLSASSFYDNGSTTVCGNVATPTAPCSSVTTPSVDFDGAQAVIDVTGQAKNVLKRLREVVPINGVGGNPGSTSTALPIEALEGQNICKRFDVYPGYFNADSGDPSCSLN